MSVTHDMAKEEQCIAYDDIFNLPCYGLKQQDKDNILLPALKKLTAHHGHHCKLYKQLITSSDVHSQKETDYPLPLSVRLFKFFDLLSIESDQIFKTLTSSGTTGQNVSKIYLDQEVARLQSIALVKILQSFIGVHRLPMLIIDTPTITQAKNAFSARAAGIRGLATFGRDHTYVLDDHMEVNISALCNFLEKYSGQPILMFGFTFMVWQYLFQKLKSMKQSIDLSNAILIHSGGWKKMIEQAVDNATFKQALGESTGIRQIHNFYGMVEQVGSIFMECEAGYLHAPIFSDIRIKNLVQNCIQPLGIEGVIEVFSILPKSYPGHALLTEDLGTVWGIDDCSCGRKGKYFTVSGRIPKAEVRGCSDVHVEKNMDEGIVA